MKTKILEKILKNRLEISILATIFLLIFIWPIPHTIALRNILSLFLLFGIGILSFKNGIDFNAIKKIKTPLILLSLFIIWAFFQAVVISPTTIYSLKEITGQLLQASLYFFISISILFIKDTKILNIKNLFLSFFWALFFHILVLDISSIYLYLKEGTLHLRYGGPLVLKFYEMNYLTNLFSVFVIGELFFRFTFNKKFLPLSNILLLSIFILIIFSLYIETTRFGVITFSILLITFVILHFIYAKKEFKHKFLVISFIVLSIISLGYLDYKYDKRWKTLFQTIPLALDLNSSKHWIDSTKYPLPKLNGKTVDQSNYLRLAQIKASLMLIGENPLGIGFGRRAYKNALIKKYGEGYGHPHSGILNMILGVGLIGALLWFLFIGYILFESFKYFKKDKNYISLILLLFVIGYTMRSFVDMTFQNHLLQFFMFFTGFLYAALKKESENEKA